MSVGHTYLRCEQFNFGFRKKHGIAFTVYFFLITGTLFDTAGLYVAQLAGIDCVDQSALNS